MSQKLQQLRETYDAARKALEKTGKSAFLEAANDLFTEEPKLVRFAWKQYTPYFNDGNTCTFSVHGDYPSINGFNQDYGEAEEDQTQEEKLSHTDQTRIGKKVSKLINALPEEILQDMFGDHVQVTVFKNGQIEIDEYSHD